jgi:hypothetical protein
VDDDCPECLAPDRDTSQPCPVCGTLVLLAPVEVDTRAVDVTPVPMWSEPRGDA